MSNENENGSVATQDKAKRADSVPAPVFVPIVEASESVEEVIAKVKEKTGITMTESNVKIKMGNLRKNGVPHLKTFPRKPRTRIDYAALDALTAAAKQVEEAKAEQEKAESESTESKS